MARTDAHLPGNIRLLESHRRVAVHNHAHGPCDLLPIEEWVKNEPGWREVRCRWDLTLSEYWEHPLCGCWMCTGQGDRRRARRVERYSARDAIWEGLQDWLADMDEVKAEAVEAAYEASVEAKWREITDAVERRWWAVEAEQDYWDGLRECMESVPGVGPSPLAW